MRIDESPDRGGRPRLGSPPRRDDLILDFSEMGPLDVRSLAMLLTARELACSENRDVWSTGLPLHTRWALSALGLDDYFPPLPADFEV